MTSQHPSKISNARSLSLVAALFALSISASATTALAQAPGMPASPTGSQPTVGQPGPNGAYPDAPAPGTQASYADQMFLKDTLKDDQLQVQMSQLAQQKASNDQIKQFGQSMVKLHTELDTQLMPLVHQFAINKTQKPSKKEKEQLAKLETLSGPGFDTAYLQAMVAQQQQMLKQFKQEADAAENLTLQRTVKADQPTLVKSLDALKKLAAANNVPVDTK